MTDRPFEISRLDHVVLRTADPGRLRDFYVSLGCRVERENTALGLTHLRAGVSMIDLVDVAGPLGRAGGGAPAEGSDVRNMDHLALRIEPWDPDAVARFCAERGIACHLLPTLLFGADGLGPAVYLTDPDGNRVELKGPPEAQG
jgi:catechol 2,3-dioxygenase-like lactoylglutathione lyase family enzyme